MHLTHLLCIKKCLSDCTTIRQKKVEKRYLLARIVDVFDYGPKYRPSRKGPPLIVTFEHLRMEPSEEVAEHSLEGSVKEVIEILSDDPAAGHALRDTFEIEQ